VTVVTVGQIDILSAKTLFSKQSEPARPSRSDTDIVAAAAAMINHSIYLDLRLHQRKVESVVG